MLYCVRVYRGGIGEEDVVDHVGWRWCCWR